MITRTQKRLTDEDAGFYASVLLEGEGTMRTTHLRILLPSRAAGLVAWMYRTKDLSVVDVEAKEAEGKDCSPWEAAELAQWYMSAIQGRIIGAMWGDDDHDLVALAKDHETPEAMGFAVVEELYTAGWCMTEIRCLFEAAVEVCIKTTAQRGLDAKEIHRFVNFGAPTMDSPITPSSQPDSNTLATSAP